MSLNIDIKSLKESLVLSSKVNKLVVGSKSKEPTITKELKFHPLHTKKYEKGKNIHAPFRIINKDNILYISSPSSPSSYSSIDFNNIHIGVKNDNI